MSQTTAPDFRRITPRTSSTGQMGFPFVCRGGERLVPAIVSHARNAAIRSEVTTTSSTTDFQPSLSTRSLISATSPPRPTCPKASGGGTSVGRGTTLKVVLPCRPRMFSRDAAKRGRLASRGRIGHQSVSPTDTAGEKRRGERRATRRRRSPALFTEKKCLCWMIDAQVVPELVVCFAEAFAIMARGARSDRL